MKIVIVGAGPAGLAVANDLKEAGHRVVVFDKGPVAGNITRYPYYMTWFSTRELLELGDVPMTIPTDKPTRREYLHYLARFVQVKQLEVRTYEEVRSIEGVSGNFTVKTRRLCGKEQAYSCEAVVLAIGAYDHPMMLNIPGEDLPKVSHYYLEPHPFINKKVLVIGGRNSAVEAALEIWRNGAEVTLSYRQEQFPASLKYWLKPDIENRIKAGQVKAFMPSQVVKIEPNTVTLRFEGKEIEVENDFVLALTGYRPDSTFLRNLGIQVDPTTNRPLYDPESYETNIPGIYVAGVMQAGNISSEIFVENSRVHGKTIRKALKPA